MTKGLIAGAISLDVGVNCQDGHLRHVVGSLDPRCSPANHLRSYASPDLAQAAFWDALCGSRNNGWTVAYLGDRNYG